MRRSLLLAAVALGVMALPKYQAFAQTAGDPSAPPANDGPAAVPNPGLTPVAPAPLPLVPRAQVAQATAPAAPAAPTTCNTSELDPYKNYACLDDYLGTGFWERFINYYRLEDGHAAPPTDPNAPPGRIDGWPRTPATVPPMAYTEWPTGALTSIGVTRPNGADSPFMVAIANTAVGQWLQDKHIQIYGWVEPGANFSSNSNRPGGNGPIPYTYTPNTVQLDQAVLYFDRWPDTVQTDHFDWGFRISGLYGENYRYTESFGLGSYQFNGANNVYGWDLPMEYVDLYFPQVLSGEEIRIGRYISIPDIEAQLAPNNVMYTHSLTYGWDNYTNTGIVFSTQINKNVLVQLGANDGTETPLWHISQNRVNLYVSNHTPGPAGSGLGPGVDPLYPGTTYPTDPGNQLSGTACVRIVWNDGWDTFYPCLDGINRGNYGYNNIQWHGFTYYHRFDDKWHLDFETYLLTIKHAPNLRNPTTQYIIANGGTPFSPQNLNYNGPNQAYCPTINTLDCDAKAVGVVSYLNYTPNPDNPLDNFSFRPEFYYDPQGWRTGTGGYTRYVEFTVGWQHWLSPQVEFRPELSYWRSFSTPAFNGQPNEGIPANHHTTVELASDAIVHF